MLEPSEEAVTAGIEIDAKRRRHATPDHDWTGFSDRPQVVARRPVDLLREPSGRWAGYLACASDGWGAETGDANRQRLSRNAWIALEA